MKKAGAGQIEGLYLPVREEKGRRRSNRGALIARSG
jgi:hypothetical protein